MKLFIPQSIFAGISIFNLDSSILENVDSRPAATIVNDVEEDKCDAAIIPSFDLLRHPDLFISRKAGISFDGALCNSYLYFKKDQPEISELSLAGDVTSNEVFLSKIIFEEMYDVKLNISLDTNPPEIDSKNYLIVGNSNFDKDLFRKGISFAEQLSEFFDYPYVNFVVASKSEDVIKELNEKFQKIDENIEDKLNTILDNLNISDDSRNFIKSNFNQVYFEITQNEEIALQEMLKYPYYKGIVKDMIDLKFV